MFTLQGDIEGLNAVPNDRKVSKAIKANQAIN